MLQPSPSTRTGKNVFPGGLERDWTPVLTFVTPGDLSVSYLANFGRYVRQGSLISGFMLLQTTSFTHTTASLDLLITGLPYPVRKIPGVVRSFGGGSFTWAGITKANYTQLNPAFIPDQTYLSFNMSGSAQAFSDVVAADVPTAGTVTLIGSFQYIATDKT